jgi:PadR family transcriptional regulator PadR
MQIENIKSQLRKGTLEYCILLIISKKRAYTSDILNELKDAQLIVVEGTLYPLLTRLKNEGILNYAWEESTQGPPRKYYEISTKGEAILNEMELAWNELSEAINQLRNTKNQSI